MSSCGKSVWCLFPAVGLVFLGVWGCGGRYEPAPQGEGEASAVAQAAGDRSPAPADTKPAQKAPAETSASEPKTEEGGGLFRAMFEPLFSAAGGAKQAAPSATEAAAKPADAASGAAPGQAAAPASPKPGDSPAKASETASTPAAPAGVPGSPGDMPPSGREQFATPGGPPGTPFGRPLFSAWQLGQRFDLMAELNRGWQVIGPRWRMGADGIVSPEAKGDANPRSILLMPCSVPREFRWTVVAERLSGTESLNLFFPLPNNRRNMVVLEASPSKISGLSLVDGAPADRNETTFRGQLFSPGKPSTIELLVRQNFVQVTCDGKKIVDFRGDETRLTLDQLAWGILPWNRLAIGVSGGTVFRITKLELEPLSTTLVGPPAMGFAGGGPPSRLSWFDGPPAGRFSGPAGPPSGRQDFPAGSGARRGPGPSSPVPPGMRPVPAPSPSPEIAGLPGASAPPAQAADARPLPPPVEVPAAVSGKQDAVCLVEHPLANGTGFVIAKNLVATNAHVMEDAFLEETKLHFSTPSAVTYKPKAIVYENVPEDLCFLEVAEVDRAPVPLVADNNVPRGQKVFIIGNPSIAPGMTARNTIGAGTVTTVMHIEGFDFYQIDGNVNPGSSGGPALNERGELVGIISMKAEDRVAETIRHELRRLDEKFRAESQEARGVGIAYSIPIVRIRTALDKASKATEATKRQNLVLHHSRSLFQRAAAVAIYHTLRLEVNVPQQVRDQAWKIRTAPRRPGMPRIEEIELMPAPEAMRLGKLLDAQEAREGVRNAAKGLKERLEELRHYEEADAEVLENIQRLLETAEKAEEAASNPPKSYQRFVDTLKGLRNGLKRSIPPLAERLQP